MSEEDNEMNFTDQAEQPASDLAEEEDDGQSYTWNRKNDTPRQGDDDDDYDYEDDPIIEGVDDLPLFADDENKKLHAAIKAKEARTTAVETDVKDIKSRVEIMGEHLKNVRQELVHTQQLVDAKSNELKSEEHLRQLALREAGRVKQDLKKVEIEASEAQDQLNVVQNYIFKGNDQMDEFKTQMNWNQDEMEQWALAGKQKEEDNLALEKYTRADEVKIKELTLELERLTKELQQKKNELEDEATETQAKQIELDKAADEFKTLHTDRQKLVQQWQELLENMARRDGDINKAGEEFAVLKEKLEEQKAILAENKNLLEIQEAENVEMQNKISAKERMQSKARQELQAASEKLQEFKDEVEIMKNELSSAAGQLTQQRNQNQNKTAELEELKMDLESDRARYKATKAKLEKFKNSTLDAEAIAREAEEDMALKESMLKKVIKEIGQLKEVTFRQSQELFNYRQEEANMIAEISGAQAASRNINTKIKQLDQETLRQQELVYNGEFQIQQMERKVARAAGHRTVDETKTLKAEIDVLQAALDQAKAQHAMLTTQCKKLDEEYRKQQRLKMDTIKDREVLQNKIAELELENESSAATLNKQLKLKEETLVSHDVLKLEVKRLKDVLNSRADEVYSLENRKFQLQMSMEERKKEISVHRDVQRAQVKAAEEERHRVSLEFSERRMHVEKLQSRYETLCKLTGLGAGGEEAPDGERSQAYFVIKAAQKREELQREGDDLDDKIRVTERDLRRLQKAHSHLAVRNTEFRKSLHKADSSSTEAQKMLQLEEQNQSAVDGLFKRKKELQRLQSDLEEDSRRLENVQNRSSQLVEQMNHLDSAYQQVVYEVNTQKEKMTRARKKVQHLVKKHRSARKTSEKTSEELAFSAQTSKELVGNVLYTLGQLANEFPEISDDLSVALQENNLKIPSRPHSRISSTLQSRSTAAAVRPLSAASDRSDFSTSSSDSTLSTKSTSSIKSTSSYKSTASTNSIRNPVAVHQVQLGL